MNSRPPFLARRRCRPQGHPALARPGLQPREISGGLAPLQKRQQQPPQKRPPSPLTPSPPLRGVATDSGASADAAALASAAPAICCASPYHPSLSPPHPPVPPSLSPSLSHQTSLPTPADMLLPGRIPFECKRSVCARCERRVSALCYWPQLCCYCASYAASGEANPDRRSGLIHFSSFSAATADAASTTPL